jgi:hypothetical protein
MAMPSCQPAERYRRAVVEMARLRRHFPTFACRIAGDRLQSRGTLHTDTDSAYRVELTYRAGSSPKIWVTKPRILHGGAPHMYRDNSLCLFDWREEPWHHRMHLHETIIPWTAEWLVFYEIYLLTGKWLGKSAPHTLPERIKTN